MPLSNSEFSNVYDLAASRKVKERTGVTTGVKIGKDSPELTKHENEALSFHPKPKKNRMKNLGNKILDTLGLSEEYLNQ